MKTLKTAQILLTGGTGFFGRALLRHWLTLVPPEKRPSQVLVVSRDPSQFLLQYPEFRGHDWLSFHEGDVCCARSLPAGYRFTHILHAATESTRGPCFSPLERFWQIVEGTRNILDLAVASGAQRFLLTSSAGVYGPQPANLPALTEGWPGSPALNEPANAYALGKRAAEHLCAIYQATHGLEPVIARCFAFVGPDLPLTVHFAIGNFIRDALRREPITVAGDGTPLRTYLDQADLAQWLLTLLAHGRAGEAYNVGSDEVISLADLAHLVRDVLAPGETVRILGGAEAALGRARLIPDITKARQELGLEVTIPLREAIRRTGLHHQGSAAL